MTDPEQHAQLLWSMAESRRASAAQEAEGSFNRETMLEIMAALEAGAQALTRQQDAGVTALRAQKKEEDLSRTLQPQPGSMTADQTATITEARERVIRAAFDGLAGKADVCAALDSYAQAVALPMRELLRQAQESVCSLRCPSTWKTGERPPHSDLCRAITERLDTSRSQSTGGDSRDFGKHEDWYSQ